MAALLAGASAQATTVVTTFTTFTASAAGCAGTQLLPVLDNVPPLQQPFCQPELPLGPGSASHAESADPSGNMSLNDSATFGTPVLAEIASSEPFVRADLGLAGPARSVVLEAVLDLDPLT
jgi:hypothetical protein